jgi:1-acyl-sn-glycerol-3-phosphate acyltransferase
MVRLLKALVEALFRVLFTYDCLGEENVPAAGPAVVAANHPSYLDPVLLSLQVRRPIRFMAWDRLFRVPGLGALLRAFGAFPVDVRPGAGLTAYERARALVEQGEVVGIFPEGKRSRTGWMEAGLREGAARLSLETGAPLVPATIVGAFRAWPYFRALPHAARIRVRFHAPIDPAAYRGRPVEEGLPSLLAELRARVERTLLPGVKADLRMDAVYARPGPWPRWHEYLPALALAVLVVWKTGSVRPALPAYLYLGYLFLDHALVPQRRLAKWIRNGSPLLLLLGYAPYASRLLGVAGVPAARALGALVLGAAFPYLYERGRTSVDFVRGFVLAAAAEGGVLAVSPQGLGLHVALPLYAAAFAWDRKSVYWPYSLVALLAWALLVPTWLGGRGELMTHGLGGLLGWLGGRLLPYHPPPASPPERPAVPGLGL